MGSAPSTRWNMEAERDSRVYVTCESQLYTLESGLIGETPEPRTVVEANRLPFLVQLIRGIFTAFQNALSDCC